MNIDVMLLTPELLTANLTSLINIDRHISSGLWGDEEFMKEIPGKWNFSYVFLDKKDIVGFSIVSKRNNNCAHLHRIAFLPQYQGRGYGKYAINHVSTILKENEIMFLTLKVPLDNNKALLFYENNGFYELFNKNNHAFMLKCL